MNQKPQPGAGSYGGGRGADYPAREEGATTDATLGNGSKGADRPPLDEHAPLGWSVGPVAPVTSPTAEKAKGGG